LSHPLASLWVGPLVSVWFPVFLDTSKQMLVVQSYATSHRCLNVELIYWIKDTLT
jgi:hypothetical protein